MTASDHLKQRLATGSLGGDQDEKAVEELIAEKEADASVLSAVEQCIAVMGNEGMQGSYAAPREAFQKIILAALAQKTRECEEFERKGKDLSSAYGNSLIEIHDLKAQIADKQRLLDEDQYIAEANLDLHARLNAAEAQVEQLQRQVAEMSKPVTDEEWNFNDELLPTPALQKMFKLMRTTIDSLLASRARTK